MKSRFFHFTLYAIIVYLTCTTLNAITGTATASENHNVMLRVVRVTTDWMPFASTGGWPQAVRLKESEVLKYYEVAIWEETSSVHFYVFPNDYDGMYETRSGVTDAQKIAYREQFLIKKYTDMPNVWTDADERSTFLKSAFMDIASYLVNQHPSSEHHLMYSGHGGPGGRLFAGLLYINDANEFLNSWTESLGKPLGVIDMGGPCNQGGFSDLDNFCEYARYYVASDLPNGGYTMDQWTFEKYKETQPETQYHALFSANQSLEEVLIGRINLKRKAYEYSRNNMINNRVSQANYLYSCAAFRKFSANFKVFLSSTGVDYDIYDDLYQYMIDNNASPTLIQQFSDVFVHKADNRDFFEWGAISNGMTMPDKGLLDQLRELGTTTPITPVSERTPQVRDAIVAAVLGVNSAADVTEAHLAAITELNLRSKGITSLKSDDFDGLTSLTNLNLLDNDLTNLPEDVFEGLSSLTTLNLAGNNLGSLSEGMFDGLTALTTLDLGFNDLSSLPEGVFDGLTALGVLTLGGNDLSRLPEDVFDGLTALTTLNLGDNDLSSLPEDVFDGLTALSGLYLGSNDLSSLPEDVFDGLTALTTLDLAYNDLSSLPDGVFDGLTALSQLYLSSNDLSLLPNGIFDGITGLTHLSLGQNTVNPLPITVSLEKIGDGQFKAVAPTGAPFDIVLRIRDTYEGPVRELTIPAGSKESEVLTVTRRDTSHAVSVWIGPALPRLLANHSGYELLNSTSRSDQLVIFEDISEQIWLGTITVGSWGNAWGNGNATGYGYSRRDNAGSISNATFTYRGTTYTIHGIGFAKVGNNPAYKHVLTISPGFPVCDRKLLRLGGFHLADASRGSLGDPSSYIWHGRWAIWEPIGRQRSWSITFHPTVPDVPVVTATNEGHQVTLSWETPCDGGKDIIRHEYRQKARNGEFGSWIPIPNSAVGGVNVASYTLTGVNNPQENIYEVRAVNELGEGAVSAPAAPSDRTPQVAEAILEAVKSNDPNVSSYADITDSHLAAITTLNVRLLGIITTLKVDDFEGLTSLEELNLWGSRNLTGLPNGIFEGLTSLTRLQIYPIFDSKPITVSLERVADGQFKAIVPTGAPFSMELPLTITNGSISGGVTSVTIPVGSVESEVLTVTRTPDTTGAVTVNIGTLPSLPSSHRGYALVKSTDLPLTFTAPSETTLMAIKGTITADGTPAEAGLQVTATIGSTTKTATSEAGGGYSVIFLSTQGIVATSGDTVTVHVLNANTGATAERTVPLSSAQIAAKKATIDLQFSTTTEYLLSVPIGISLIHVPLEVTAVDGATQTLESVADLYDALGGASSVSLLITLDPQAQQWRGYFGSGDRGSSADKVLTDDLGIIAVMTAAVSVQLSGDALGTNGSSSITLHPGMNLVGVPLNDSRITRVSDLLALEGMNDNITLAIVSNDGEIKLTESAGDSGDIGVTGGQSFILVAKRAATVEITGAGWSNSDTAVAPSMALTGIEVTDITPVLAVTGSIGSPVGGASLPRPSDSGFRVTVKNLSTGTVDTATTDGEGGGYRLTFVDIETGRAAQVGDILELSAQSPYPLIGVHPVRHTVTVEDVKRSRISLAELVAYEIPAKTALLLNYPNPFNPETWIPYRLAKDAFVTLTIYDLNGHKVRQLNVGHQLAAVYESRSEAIYWDGRTEYGERVASGIYFYTLIAGDYSATRKMVILK